LYKNEFKNRLIGQNLEEGQELAVLLLLKVCDWRQQLLPLMIHGLKDNHTLKKVNFNCEYLFNIFIKIPFLYFKSSTIPILLRFNNFQLNIDIYFLKYCS